ncbi:MAG TPA: LytTR family transcriptional regulator DNA-binding domain-containing protein [Bacteroidales bacterium]|nr:LytTR family transcriptional regulator DNA-binding domain-containing protein [Bacteroidales bacterium]HPS62157.1 LytTR family transcriptional regulator DNA-binding domain-containing protein [Bacteroidales bacterium]
MNLRTLLIDDEQPARDVVRHYLKDIAGIEIIGECSDGFSGLKAIQEMKPDLVFLDVQMPRLTGLELVELLEQPPMIIFSTAYDQYAIKAFEMNAVDYLLKPYSKERFLQAVQKAVASATSGVHQSAPVQNLVKALEENPEFLMRIAVKSRHKVTVIPVEEIVYLEAEGDYVMIHTKDARHLKEKTMKYFETHLDPGQFIRIHRSYIVNAKFIDRIEYYDKENYAVLTKTGAKLRASTSGYKILKEALNM